MPAQSKRRTYYNDAPWEIPKSYRVALGLCSSWCCSPASWAASVSGGPTGVSQAVQLARCGALLAEAWEAAVVEEVLFRGVLLWACLSWARRRNEAYPRRAPRAHRHRFAGLRAVVDPVGFAVMASSLIFGLAHLFPEGSLMAPGADIGVAAIQGVLKVTQSTLFGVCHGAARRS